VPETEKDRRLQDIQALLRDQQAAFNGVRLASRGNRIAISGGAGRTEMAEAALLALWKRLEQGQHARQ
jgi:hypothetical protein